ncbi:MAG: 3-oxoacyl-ACP reductase FabG [Opitutales bacterium]|nr:3-oxoacyl-ACP reductase FabG [Opitutales bacterium]
MKRILITGSSRGIGKAIAQALARQSLALNGAYSLVLHANKNLSAAQELAQTLTAAGTPATALAFDVSDREQCAAVLNADIEANGAFWGVVCNAGITADNAFPMLSGDEWDRVLRTNLDGFYNVLQTLVMPMVRLRDGGRIVTLSSVSGIVGNRGQVNYSASKAGIIGATKALAVEMAKRKITVNCVAPGFIDTDMTANLLAPKEEIFKAIPMQRAGTPEEVAATVAFLFSPEAAYITRQVISVNGGLC